MPLPISTRRVTLDREAFFKAHVFRLTWRLLSSYLYMSGVFVALAWIEGASTAGYVVAAIGGALLMFVVIAFKTWKQIFRPSNPSLFADRTLVFSEDSVTFASSSGIESTAPWSVFLYGTRTGSFVMLYTSKTTALALPDGAFASQADEDEAFELISRSVKWKGSKPIRAL